MSNFAWVFCRCIYRSAEIYRSRTVSSSKLSEEKCYSFARLLLAKHQQNFCVWILNILLLRKEFNYEKIYKKTKSSFSNNDIAIYNISNSIWTIKGFSSWIQNYLEWKSNISDLQLYGDFTVNGKQAFCIDHHKKTPPTRNNWNRGGIW